MRIVINIVIGIAFLATVAAIAFMYRVATGNGYYGAIVELNNLNLIGDTLGGFFASLAFIWILVGVLMQRHELSLTQDALKDAHNETQKQTRLSYEAAHATYQLEMFDRRISVYNRLQEVAMSIVIHAEIPDEQRREFFKAQHEARFFFDKDVNDYLSEVEKRLVEAGRQRRKIQRLIEKPDLKDDEQAQLDQAWQIRHTMDDWLIENLSAEKIDEILMQHLKLPEKIKDPNEVTPK